IAQLLRQRYDERPGSWLNAAARYHRPAGGAPAARYRKLVSRHLPQATPP
ncbi:transglycosylase, partial [Salmonella enterica]|nr:transglycosylase [Salmonella enterica subsp. enterica serovar Reading]